MNAGEEQEQKTAPAGDAAFVAADASNAVVDLLRAWSGLFASELAVAHRSLHWLAFGLIAAPVIGLGAWLGVCALLVAAAQAWTGSWLLALTFGAGIQVLALALLLRQLRHWTRDLSLPRSRAALARAMGAMS